MGAVVHMHKTNPWTMKVGGSEIQDQLQLLIEFKARLDYLRTYLIKT